MKEFIDLSAMKLLVISVLLSWTPLQVKGQGGLYTNTVNRLCKGAHNHNPLTIESNDPDFYEIMNLAMTCVSIELLPLLRDEDRSRWRNDPNLHISVLQRNTQLCLDMKIHYIQMVIMGGEHDKAMDRLPVGFYDLHHHQKVSEDTLRDFGKHRSVCPVYRLDDKDVTKYHRDSVDRNVKTNICRQSPERDYYNDDFSNYLLMTGEPSRTSDDKLKWFPLFCSTWHYTGTDQFRVDGPAKIENIFLDLIVDMSADFNLANGRTRKVEVSLNKLGFGQYRTIVGGNNDFPTGCERLHNYVRNAPRWYNQQQQFKQINFACDCKNSKQVPPAHSLILRNDERVDIQNVEHHYDKRLRTPDRKDSPYGCLHFRTLNVENQPAFHTLTQILFFELHVKSRCITQKIYPSFRILGDSPIILVALDEFGLAIGNWISIKESTVKDKWVQNCDNDDCTRIDDDLVYINLNQKVDEQTCPKPDGYDIKEPTRTDIPHYWGKMEAKYPLPKGRSYGFIFGFQNKYHNIRQQQNAANTFQIIAQVPIQKSSGNNHAFFPEILVVRSEVYKYIKTPPFFTTVQTQDKSYHVMYYQDKTIERDICDPKLAPRPPPPPLTTKDPPTTIITTTQRTTSTTTQKTSTSTSTSTSTPTSTSTSTPNSTPRTTSTSTTPTTTTTTTTTPAPQNFDFNLCRNFRQGVRRIEAGRESADSIWRKCFSLEAFPGRQPNTLHITFRQFPKKSAECLNFIGTEFAFHTENENGYPTGETTKSFKIYYKHSNPDQCENEDMQLSHVDEFSSKNYDCFFADVDHRHDKYSQFVTPTKLPSMFLYENRKIQNRGGICLLWTYHKVPHYHGETPKTIQIIAEIFVPKFLSGEPEDVVIFLKSQPYEFTYKKDDLIKEKRECHDTADLTDSGFKLMENPEQYFRDLDEEFYGICRGNIRNCPVAFDRRVTAPPTLAPPDISAGTTEMDWDTTLRPLIPEFHLNIYKDCGITKGCISNPKSDDPFENDDSSCIKHQSCDMVLAFGKSDDEHNNEDELVLEIYHRSTEKWAAIGISLRPVMEDAFVLECVDEPDGVNVYSSFNSISTYANQRFRGDQSHDTILRKIATERVGLSIYCKFYIKMNFERTDPGSIGHNEHHYDLKREPYYIIWAWGSGVTANGIEGNLKPHKEKLRGRSKAFVKTALASRFAPLPSQMPYLRAHSYFMGMAIIFFMSMGTFVGRYFKETFVKIKICNISLWLVVHAGSMTIAIGFVCAGMIFEVIGAEGWRPLTQSPFHSYCGMICCGTLVYIYASGFFIQVSVYGRKNYANAAHGVGGHLMYCLGLCLLVESERVSFSGVPCTVKWIVCTWIFSYVFLNMAMTYHYLWVDWVAGLKRGRIYGIRPIGIFTERHLKHFAKNKILDRANRVDPVEAPGRWVRVGAFLIFFFLAFFYSNWVIRVIYVNVFKKRDCFTPAQIAEMYPH